MRMEYFYEMWNWIDMMVISGMSECQKVNKCQYQNFEMSTEIPKFQQISIWRRGIEMSNK